MSDCCVLVRDPIHLLLLNRRWCDIHAENDVFDFTLSQTGDVDVIFLGVVRQYQVLKFDLDVDPLFICQSWPDVVRLSNN